MIKAGNKIDIKKLGSFKQYVTTAVRYSLCMQFVLLLVFLLFINFHILHPVQWITYTLNSMCSIGTWISLMPLLCAVLLYDILFYHRLMTKKIYYASRFARLTKPLLSKLTFFGIHILVATLSALLYISYLPLEYRQFRFDCYGSKCLNSRYAFLVYIGFMSGFYHYVKNYAYQNPELELSIVQQRRVIQLRTLIYTTIYNTLWQTIIPIITLTLAYLVLNRPLNVFFARILLLNVDERSDSLLDFISDFPLFIYAWLLLAHILSNFQLFYSLFCIAFSENLDLPISKDNDLSENERAMTLPLALVTSKAPLLQSLAALQLYFISVDNARRAERQEIFALTRLSEHPFNWHELRNNCLLLIDTFIENLQKAVKKIPNIKMTPIINNLAARPQRPSASEMAQHILLRQHTEALRIHSMLENPCTIEQRSQPTTQKFNELNILAWQKDLKTIIMKFLYKIPCIYYLFGEPESGKAVFLLSNSQHISWVILALTNLCAISIVEDRYGVVQSSLNDVFSTLLKLKTELDKLNNINLNGKKVDRNFVVLKNAVRRGLYKMCSAFGDYLRDIVTDSQQLQQLQYFMSYQET